MSVTKTKASLELYAESSCLTATLTSHFSASGKTNTHKWRGWWAGDTVVAARVGDFQGLRVPVLLREPLGEPILSPFWVVRALGIPDAHGQRLTRQWKSSLCGGDLPVIQLQSWCACWLPALMWTFSSSGEDWCCNLLFFYLLQKAGAIQYLNRYTILQFWKVSTYSLCIVPFGCFGQKQYSSESRTYI